MPGDDAAPRCARVQRTSVGVPGGTGRVDGGGSGGAAGDDEAC